MKKIPAFMIACSLVIAGIFAVPTAHASQFDCRIDQVNTTVVFHEDTGLTDIVVVIINDYGGANSDCEGMTVRMQKSGAVFDSQTVLPGNTVTSEQNFGDEPGDYTISIGLYTNEAEPFFLDGVDRPYTVPQPTPADTPLTAVELDAFGEKYIMPFYKVIGMVAAMGVLYAAYAFVLKPWLRRFR